MSLTSVTRPVSAVASPHGQFARYESCRISHNAVIRRQQLHALGGMATSASASRPSLPPPQATGDCEAAAPQLSADHRAPSTSGRTIVWSIARAAAVAAVATTWAPAVLAAEVAPQGFFDTLVHVVDGLGAFGPVALIAAMAFCECIPLFPTQPLSLASGLLFGTRDGAICIVAGTTLAAVIAFQLARGVGRPLAERLIRAEMSEEGGGASASPGPVQSRLLALEETIANGSFWQQTAAIFALRLTPLLPYSASNYLLGLSPLPFGPYLLGTLAGMVCWAPLYAGVGGASRSLLLRGANPDALMADVLERAAGLSRDAAAVGVVVLGIVAAAALAVYGVKKLRHEGASGGNRGGAVAPRELVEEHSEG